MTRIAPMTWWRAGLNLAGALAVVWTLWRVAPGVEGWVVALVALGIAAWLVRAGLGLLLGSAATGIPAPPRPPVADGEAPIAFESGAMRALAAGLVVVMAAAGAITAVPTQGLGAALFVIAVLIACSDPETSAAVWAVLAGGVALGIVGGALLAQGGLTGPAGKVMDVLGVLAVLVALPLAIMGGLGRRAQRVLARERERAAADALRAQATADRVAIARDLHDVLAHSLGGLVVQLDAAEGLLENGDVDAARTRVTTARALAVEGLREAREAVRTLRGVDETGSGTAPPAVASPVEPAELDARIRTLLDAHAGLGGTARFEAAGAPRPVSGALAEAIVRAVQEGLSNARKHAPGGPVRIALTWDAGRVECTIANGAGAVTGAGTAGGDLTATGGGYGLRGLRERFETLGGSVHAGPFARSSGEHVADERDEPNPAAGDFVLRIEAPA